jgi:hypothetical protein
MDNDDSKKGAFIAYCAWAKEHGIDIASEPHRQAFRAGWAARTKAREVALTHNVMQQIREDVRKQIEKAEAGS